MIIDDDDDPPLPVMYQAASPNKIKSPVVNQMSPGVLPIVSASISPDYTSASVAQLNPAPTANAETVCFFYFTNLFKTNYSFVLLKRLISH